MQINESNVHHFVGIVCGSYLPCTPACTDQVFDIQFLQFLPRSFKFKTTIVLLRIHKIVIPEISSPQVVVYIIRHSLDRSAIKQFNGLIQLLIQLHQADTCIITVQCIPGIAIHQNPETCQCRTKIPILITGHCLLLYLIQFQMCFLSEHNTTREQEQQSRCAKKVS